jgi:hypothetical protein
VSVSDPGDRFERAAADNASRVMSEPAPVQRQAAEEEPEEESVQGLFVQRQEEPEEEEAAAT